MKRVFSRLKRRIKSQRGLSGVIVALLLVLIGVALVAGIGTWLSGHKTAIQQKADTEINNTINSQ